MTNKTKVIYVSGVGHSGTTLLNLILGSSPKVFAAGEVKALQDFMKEHLPTIQTPEDFSFNCDCGKKLNNCKFWSPILEDTDPDNLFSRHIPFTKKIAFTLPGLTRNSEQQYQDSTVYANMLKRAREIRGDDVEYIVDSSKDFSRLTYLNTLESINLHVIHMVRDGRGVVNSHEKGGNYFWLKTYAQWFLSNAVLSFYLQKNLPEQHITLSYDQFAQEPKKYLKKINSWLNLQLDTNNFIQQVNKEQYHNVGGNTMRKEEIKEIYYDRSWEKEMTKWKQWILTILCFLPNKYWIYNEDKPK